MMKCFLLAASLLISLPAWADPSGDEILALVRSRLPTDPLRLTGNLRIQAANGFTKTRIPVEIKLNWGEPTPSAQYTIGPETLTITWHNNTPHYTLDNANGAVADFDPDSEILSTGVYWTDLSFSMLWWPDAIFIQEEKKINRRCYVVEVPVPHSDETMRLWIEKEMGMLMEAHTLNAKGKRIRRMKIKSIKKLEGEWMPKDLDLDNAASDNKTTLEINELTWEPIILPEETIEPEFSAIAFDAAEANNLFAFDLYRQLATAHTNNIALSPYSISSAFAMVYGGARGTTAAELKKALYLADQSVTHPAFAALGESLSSLEKAGTLQLSIANALWPQKDYPLDPDYLDLTATYYNAETHTVDYASDPEAARTRINQWTREKTAGKITTLIPEGTLTPLTRLVLANAIYFKGRWATPFKKEATREAPFYGLDGTVTNLPTMFVEETFNLAFSDTLQALELPYDGGNLSMLILLPTAKDGLPALEKALNTDLLEALEFHPKKVMVHLPLFKLATTLSLRSTLQTLGIQAAFAEETADFSGMTGQRELFLTEAIHKAVLEVNEEGTEAAAATGVAFGVTSLPPQFNADHPFIYLIRDNTSGAILFLGRVMNPAR
jgi:serpin B